MCFCLYTKLQGRPSAGMISLDLGCRSKSPTAAGQDAETQPYLHAILYIARFQGKMLVICHVYLELAFQGHPNVFW